MSLRKQPHAVKSMEQLGSYITRTNSSVPGELRQRVNDDGIDYVDTARGTYVRAEDGSVTFEIGEYQRTGSHLVSEDTFACNAFGVVVISRRELPATDQS